MATWGEFARAAPDMGQAGRELWQRHGLMFLATVRADGSPRVHPVAPVLASDRLFVAIAGRSPKGRDLRRDPRCVLHCLPGPRDDEFVLRCRAHERPDALGVLRVAALHEIHDDDLVVELDIERVDHGWWERVGRPDTTPIRRRWTPQPG